MERHQVFISYARGDSSIAEELATGLEERGVKVWIDTKNLLPGEKWQQVIKEAIKQSRFFLALLSKNSISKRGFVQKEVKFAFDVLDEYPPGEIFVVPIRIEECEPRDERLQELHWLDLFPDWRKGIEKLVETLSTAISTPETIEVPFAQWAEVIRKNYPDASAEEIIVLTNSLLQSVVEHMEEGGILSFMKVDKNGDLGLTPLSLDIIESAKTKG